MLRFKMMSCAALAALAASAPAAAHESEDHGGVIRADSHAPIGVMGDHMHKAGEFMISYRAMRMEMDGVRDGTDTLSPEEVTTVSSPFGPGTLRVVPTQMTMDMHMVGGMYAPTDWATLMVMGSYISKDMDHITFQGVAGATVLGTFNTKSEGFGDTKVSAMFRLFDTGDHKAHVTAGLSLPTGSIEETDDILTPMGTRPTVRLPYSMQLGSGTYDLLPGITYTGHADQFGWGAQASGVVRLGRNSEGYSLGDVATATAWGSFSPAPWISLSARAIGETQGAINGRDDQIAAPVQTADPDNYGGETVSFGLGVNLAGQEGWLRGHRLAAEVVLPAYRDLNGPQLETDWTAAIGYQFAF